MTVYLLLSLWLFVTVFCTVLLKPDQCKSFHQCHSLIQHKVRAYPRCGISAARHEHVDGWMQIQIIHCAEVSVIVPNYLKYKPI